MKIGISSSIAFNISTWVIEILFFSKNVVDLDDAAIVSISKFSMALGIAYPPNREPIIRITISELCISFTQLSWVWSLGS